MYRPSFIDSALFVLLFSGPPKFRGRDPTASLRGELDLVAVLHIAIWAAGFLWVLYRLFPLLVQRGMVPRPSPPQIVAGLLLACLSLSVGMSPGVLLSGFMVWQLVGMLLFASVFVLAFGVESTLRHLFWGCTALALLTIAAWAFMPELVVAGSAGRLRGDQLTQTGPLAALGIVLALSGIVRLNRLVLIAVLAAFGLLLLAAQTRTVYVPVALFLLGGGLVGTRLPVRRGAVWLLPALVVMGMLDLMPSAQQYLVRETESISSMSDRVPLWQHMSSVMWEESPAVGLGYYAASRTLGPQYNPALGNAHSAFVEVLVGGGVISFALLLVLVIMLLWWFACAALLAPHDPAVVAIGGLLLVCLSVAFTNSEGINASPVGFAFWCLAALVPSLVVAVRAERVRLAQRTYPSATSLRPRSAHITHEVVTS